MGLVRRVALQTFIVIILKTNVYAVPFNADSSQNAVNALSKILDKRSHGPLIVILNKSSKSNDALRSIDDPTQIDEEKAKRYMLDILRSTGDDSDPLVHEANMKFEHALRARCSQEYHCEIKCTPIKKPREKQNCQKSCKDVYDHLMICNPPGGQKKKDKQCGTSKDCGGSKWNGFGKTLPPSWR